MNKLFFTQNKVGGGSINIVLPPFTDNTNGMYDPGSFNLVLISDDGHSEILTPSTSSTVEKKVKLSFLKKLNDILIQVNFSSQYLSGTYVILGIEFSNGGWIETDPIDLRRTSGYQYSAYLSDEIYSTLTSIKNEISMMNDKDFISIDSDLHAE